MVYTWQKEENLECKLHTRGWHLAELCNVHDSCVAPVAQAPSATAPAGRDFRRERVTRWCGVIESINMRWGGGVRLRLRALCEGRSLASRNYAFAPLMQRNLICNVIYGQTFAVNITFSARLQPQFARAVNLPFINISHVNSKLQCMWFTRTPNQHFIEWEFSRWQWKTRFTQQINSIPEAEKILTWFGNVSSPLPRYQGRWKLEVREWVTRTNWLSSSSHYFPALGARKTVSSRHLRIPVVHLMRSKLTTRS